MGEGGQGSLVGFRVTLKTTQNMQGKGWVLPGHQASWSHRYPRVAGGGGSDTQPINSKSPKSPLQIHLASWRENEELAPPKRPGGKGATGWPQDGTMPNDFLALSTVGREKGLSQLPQRVTTANKRPRKQQDRS